MNLYLLTQSVNNGYDTYDSAVVAAESADVARLIHPNGQEYWGRDWSAWASTPAEVTVTLIGVATDGIESGTILASFNAG